MYAYFCAMITAQEQKFINYWQQNRGKEKKLFSGLLVSLPLGLLIGAGIILSLTSGWYERANMVANTQLNPAVLIIAVLAITVFTGIFYKKYKWEMNEQYYKELLYKKQKDEETQQAANSQSI